MGAYQRHLTYILLHPSGTVVSLVHESHGFHPLFEPDSANGAGLILIPGGAFDVLNIDHEGHTIAKQLVKRGITVFVLKYRTGHPTEGHGQDYEGIP